MRDSCFSVSRINSRDTMLFITLSTSANIEKNFTCSTTWSHFQSDIYALTHAYRNWLIYIKQLRDTTCSQNMSDQCTLFHNLGFKMEGRVVYTINYLCRHPWGRRHTPQWSEPDPHEDHHQSFLLKYLLLWPWCKLWAPRPVVFHRETVIIAWANAEPATHWIASVDMETSKYLFM